MIILILLAAIINFFLAQLSNLNILKINYHCGFQIFKKWYEFFPINWYRLVFRRICSILNLITILLTNMSFTNLPLLMAYNKTYILFKKMAFYSQISKWIFHLKKTSIAIFPFVAVKFWVEFSVLYPKAEFVCFWHQSCRPFLNF